MGKVGLLIFLVVGLGGLLLYYKGGEVAANPRALIERGVADAQSAAKRDLNQQERDLLRIQLALVDFVGRRGEPPNNLGELVPTYFDNLPKNPATGQPYPYERRGLAYVLGEEGAAAMQVASAKITTEGKGGKTGEEPFVNPNTMAPDNFVYDPTGKRDPFMPFDLSGGKAINPAAPLTSYNLSQLRVSAILISPSGDEKQSTVIVEDSAGKGYTVKLGTQIGDKNGKVVAIQPNLIKVLESSVDFTGKELTNLQEMKLEVKPADRKKKGGSRPK